jgi:hypothetical protein
MFTILVNIIHFETAPIILIHAFITLFTILVNIIHFETAPIILIHAFIILFTILVNIIHFETAPIILIHPVQATILRIQKTFTNWKIRFQHIRHTWEKLRNLGSYMFLYASYMRVKMSVPEVAFRWPHKLTFPSALKIFRTANPPLCGRDVSTITITSAFLWLLRFLQNCPLGIKPHTLLSLLHANIFQADEACNSFV